MQMQASAEELFFCVNKLSLSLWEEMRGQISWDVPLLSALSSHPMGGDLSCFALRTIPPLFYYKRWQIRIRINDSN